MTVFLGDNHNVSNKWERVVLGSISRDISYGYTASSTDKPIGPRMLRITDIQNNAVNWDAVPYCKIVDDEIEKYILRPNDIVFARTGATVGKSFLIPSNVSNSVYASYLIRVRLADGIDPKYISYFFQSGDYWFQIRENQAGIGQPNVNGSKLKKIEIPLAPPEQQKQIVAKIEQLFSHIDSGIESLNTAKQRLKQYRQSVLKAAVTGELTKEWREAQQNIGCAEVRSASIPHAQDALPIVSTSYESADKLLERILQTRRQKWEEQQLEQFKAKGKSPKNDKWKDKYQEPETSLDPLPFNIPKIWELINLDTLIFHIEAGKSFKCDERPPQKGETGIVKVSAVTWGEFDSEQSKTITDKGKINSAYRIKEGDFLFSRANTNELVGACVIVKRVDKDLLLSDKIHRFILPEEWKEWLRICLRTRYGRDEIESLATGNQDSMRNISQSNVKKIRIPLLPITELQEVIRLVNKKIDSLHRLEAEIETQLQKAQKTKQSILASAFSGKLTNL